MQLSPQQLVQDTHGIHIRAALAHNSPELRLAFADVAIKQPIDSRPIWVPIAAVMISEEW